MRLGCPTPVVTSYTYSGAAWHYDDDSLTRSKQRTWDQWRGFRTVSTRTGTAPDPVTESTDTYFQGMNGDYQSGGGTSSASLTSADGGDTVTDSDQFAGQEFEHPSSQLTATTFVPRRVLYELRASREYFDQKERCVFCDIVSQETKQELRVIESRGDFIALCPYAPRVPYETWILPRTHEAAFERMGLNRSHLLPELGALLRRTLQRIRTITESFHLVLHTSPNSLHRSGSLGYWKTIDEDYHWHIEIMPVLAAKSKSYTFKEVYYSPLTSETAIKRLREARIE